MDEIELVLDEMLGEVPRKRNYNLVFGRVAEILMQKHSLAVPPLDLRFRFALFMQEEYDAVPKEAWKLGDQAWIAGRERSAKTKLLAWIGEQIREKATG